MTTTPQIPETCPHCGKEHAAELNKRVRFECDSVLFLRDNTWLRSPDCYERELAALRAKLSAHGRVGQRRNYFGVVVTAIFEFRDFVYYDFGLIPDGAPEKMKAKYWDTLPMADTEGGVSCG